MSHVSVHGIPAVSANPPQGAGVAGCLLDNRRQCLCDGIRTEQGTGRIAASRAEGLIRAVMAIVATDVETAFLDVWSTNTPSEGIVSAWGGSSLRHNQPCH